MLLFQNGLRSFAIDLIIKHSQSRSRGGRMPPRWQLQDLLYTSTKLIIRPSNPNPRIEPSARGGSSKSPKSVFSGAFFPLSDYLPHGALHPLRPATALSAPARFARCEPSRHAQCPQRLLWPWRCAGC